MRGSQRPPKACPGEPLMRATRPPRSACGLLGACLAMALAGCASTAERTPGDPLEPLNRGVYAFNDAFDRNVARPVARGYRAATPDLVQRGVGNFFSNLDDLTVLVNSSLQLKGRKAVVTSLRLLFNTTFGVFGLIDVAGAYGLEKQNEDFGQTLGYWGVGPGPYLVLPFLGPSGARDLGGRVGDAQYDALGEIAEDDPEYWTAVLLNAVDTRARLLGATDVLDTAAIDPYTFTRDAYRRRRANLVHDGSPPPAALPGEPGAGQEDGDDFDPFSDEDDDLFEQDDAGAGQPSDP